MSRRVVIASHALAGALLGLPWASACAEDDAARIPSDVLQDETPAPGSAANASLFTEVNAEQISRRSLLVPIASPALERRVQRWLWDARGEWPLGNQRSLRLSGRVAALRIDDDSVQRNEQFDLREAAFQWRPSANDFVDIGRISLRSGVALGYNPSDFFRSRSAVDTSTRDPQAQRNNRLGTVMLSWQRILAQGSVQLVLAPRLAQADSYSQDASQRELRLGDTNGSFRGLLKGSLTLSDDLKPEVLLYHDEYGWQLGANLTRSVGAQSVVYLELAGGRRFSLFDQALRDGVALGDLPPSVPGVRTDAAQRRWQQDAAVGWTWTSQAGPTISLEFDYHQAAFSRQDWQNWQDIGSAGLEGAALAWYVRSYAAQRQEPLARRALFLRAQWDHAGHRDLYLNAFVNHNLDDDSWLVQASAEYWINAGNRLRALALATSGGARSQNGSDPARRALLIGFSHYF